MASNNDGYRSGYDHWKNKDKLQIIPEVESQGNTEAKLLAKAYKEYSKDGLSNSEREKIEKLDDILKSADIVIAKDGESAIISQENGKLFNVLAPKGRSR